ncbi:unnamed protein product [Closterium sp. NIES-53]
MRRLKTFPPSPGPPLSTPIILLLFPHSESLSLPSPPPHLPAPLPHSPAAPVKPPQRAWNCSISRGMWVPSRRLPMYNGASCPFIRSSHNCRRQGRTNFDYQKLQWWPIGCAIQRLTPARLVQQFKNKLVVVLGDSVSKNLADSIKCTLHAATPRSIKTFRLASGKTELAGTWIPRYNVRFVSVFSTHLNNATSLAGQPNTQDIKAMWQQPESLESVGGRSADKNGTAEGIARSADMVERIETMANQQSQRIDLDQLDPRVVDLLPLADIVIFQASCSKLEPVLSDYYGMSSA